MHARWIAFCALSAAITVATMMAGAQQDEGPILLPKKPVVKPAGATLLVLCDLACNWKLDGEAKGHIDAGASAKVNVELGQHMVVAVTEDGADQIKQIIEVKSSGQTVVSIELQPISDARLKAEQEARDKAGQEARDKIAQQATDKATRELQEKKQRERDQAAQEQSAGIWTDSTTGLMWTKKDNGHNITWQRASDFCKNLQLAGYSNWRMPEIDELQGIFDANVGDDHVKGNLQLSTSWQWSNTPGSSSKEAFWLSFGDGKRYKDRLSSNFRIRALCVRRSGE